MFQTPLVEDPTIVTIFPKTMIGLQNLTIPHAILIGVPRGFYTHRIEKKLHWQYRVRASSIYIIVFLQIMVTFLSNIGNACHYFQG